MAFGDSTRAQNQIDYQKGLAQNNLDNLRQQQLTQNQQYIGQYQDAIARAQQRYGDISGQYQNYMSGLSNLKPTTTFQPEYGGYQNFSMTGGFTPQGIQDIRARSIAPTRGIYQQGLDQLARQRALSGSQAGGATAIGRMAREQNAAIGDQNVNANAAIAQMVQQGQLAGLGGMSAIDQARQYGELAANQLQGQLGLGAIQGQAQLYGMTPGEASMMGNMVNESNRNMLGVQGMQNQLAQAVMDAQIRKAAIPGNFQQGLSAAGQIMGLVGAGAGMVAPFLGGGISPTTQGSLNQLNSMSGPLQGPISGMPVYSPSSVGMNYASPGQSFLNPNSFGLSGGYQPSGWGNPTNFASPYGG